MLRRIEKEIKSWSLPGFILNSIFLLFAFLVSTAIHEASHWLAAFILRCPAAIGSITLMDGWTVFECSGVAWKEIMVALAGPIGSILMGILIYHSEVPKDLERGELSQLRLLAIILFMLSGIIQLCPYYNGLDGNMAVQFGASPLFVYGLWLLMIAIVANVVISERPRKKEESAREMT